MPNYVVLRVADLGTPVTAADPGAAADLVAARAGAGSTSALAVVRVGAIDLFDVAVDQPPPPPPTVRRVRRAALADTPVPVDPPPTSST